MPELYGNTTGLSPIATKTLERIYRRRVPLEQIATPELWRSLAEASKLAGRQVGVLVHRSGQIDYVVVGDAGRLVLPDVGRLRAAEGRFRGLRLVHTHLHGEPLTRDDFVDLVRLRLDLVAVLQLAPDGTPRAISYAHNIPSAPTTAASKTATAHAGVGPGAGTTAGAHAVTTATTIAKGMAIDATNERTASPYRTIGPVAFGQLDVDFGKLINALEDEFARVTRARPVEAKDGRAILVYVAAKGDRARAGQNEIRERMSELRDLARTAGVAVVDEVVQLRERLDPKFVMGKGKLDDVVLGAAESDASVLIFDHDLSPTQASSIAKHTDLKIIDRTQLILDIFAQRAQSSDGKLQVELAQLKYSLPRLAMKDDSLSRLTGGIGGRGPGETKLEIGRRRAKERVSHLEAQLKKLAKQREQRRRRRGRLDVPIVSIVGYTNAGKSTLLNTLTESDVLAENRLFATLDTRSRRLRFPEEREVVITDTVGFIRDLPKDLFAAFRATFEETADADLILHVVDAADHAHDKHMQTTENLLGELFLDRIPRLLVFNKADLLPPVEAEGLLRAHPGSLLLCANQRETTRALLERIALHLSDRWKRSRTGDPVARALADRALLDAKHEAADDATSADADATDGGRAEAANGTPGSAPGNPDVTTDHDLTTLAELLGPSRRQRRHAAPRS